MTNKEFINLTNTLGKTQCNNIEGSINLKEFYDKYKSRGLQEVDIFNIIDAFFRFDVPITKDLDKYLKFMLDTFKDRDGYAGIINSLCERKDKSNLSITYYSYTYKFDIRIYNTNLFIRSDGKDDIICLVNNKEEVVFDEVLCIEKNKNTGITRLIMASGDADFDEAMTRPDENKFKIIF